MHSTDEVTFNRPIRATKWLRKDRMKSKSTGMVQQEMQKTQYIPQGPATQSIHCYSYKNRNTKHTEIFII